MKYQFKLKKGFTIHIDGIPVKNWSHTKEEIRKAKSLKEGITELVRNKQSTSLKEHIRGIVLDNYGEPVETANKVLELIQSHLIKEIELERIKNDYIELRQDEIINIINNL